MDENGKNQSLLLKEQGIDLRLPVWLSNIEILFTKVNKQKKKCSIYIMDINKKSQVRLTEEETIRALVCSPDGRKIAFSSNKTERHEIYLVDINEKDCKKLTATSMATYPKAFFPDGKKIIFISGKVEEDSTGYYKKYRDFDICSIDVDRKNIRKLTHIFNKYFLQLSLSPTGERIVYNDFCNDNYEIYVMDKNGNNKKRLTYNSVDDFVPTWSPDGKKIAFISDGMLYLMDPDGKNQVKLTDKTQCYVSYGVWSPDSKKIAFVAEGDIYTIDIDGKNLKNLTNTPDWDESCPSWRPVVKK
jgi:TolB protein